MRQECEQIADLRFKLNRLGQYNQLPSYAAGPPRQGRSSICAIWLQGPARFVKCLTHRLYRQDRRWTPRTRWRDHRRLTPTSTRGIGGPQWGCLSRQTYVAPPRSRLSECGGRIFLKFLELLNLPRV
jgi:hypothetical protein